MNAFSLVQIALVLFDVAVITAFVTVSSDSFSSVTCTLCEIHVPALISQENKMPLTDLPVLMFMGERQLSCTMLICERGSG